MTSRASASPTPAAGPDVTAASNAFSEAQRAEFAEDWGRAAEYYELANDIAPTGAALRSAARTRLADGDLGRAATHAESLLALYDDTDSQQLAQDILVDARVQLARVQVSCDVPCSPGVDGRATSNRPSKSHVLYLAAGERAISAGFASRGSVQKIIAVEAGGEVDLDFGQPSAPPQPTVTPRPPEPRVVTTGSAPLRDGPVEPARRPRARLSPTFFTIGVLASAGLGAAAVWSGLDVLQRHDEYEATPTKSGYDGGVTATRRTYILSGVGAAVGVATVVVAVFTDWARWRRGAKTADARPRLRVLTAGRF